MPIVSLPRRKRRDADHTVKTLSQFRRKGYDDDDMLDAFMDWARQQPFTGQTVILDESREYNLYRHHELYNGFAMRGAGRPQDQDRSGSPIANVLNLRTDGGTFVQPPNSKDYAWHFEGLSLDGSSRARLIEADGSSVVRILTLRDFSAQNIAGIAGSEDQRLLVTACAVDGYCNVNNVRETAFALGGSDFHFQPSQMLLDSPPSLMSPRGFLYRCEHLSNTWIDNVYCTADGHSGFLFRGGGDVWMKNSVVEGRNERTPCPGALVRVEGSDLTLINNRFANAMTDPSRTGRDDGGAIHVEDGDVDVAFCRYSLADGVTADTAPFLYASGGSVRVRNIRGRGFKPVVVQERPGLIDADDTVIVRTL